MKFCILVSAFCLLTSPVAQGQWLETIIPLGAYPYQLCLNPVDNKVYVSGADVRSVLVLDAATNGMIGEVPLDSWDHVWAMCYCPQRNAVYAGCHETGPGMVVMWDGKDDTITAMIDVPEYPVVLCYDSVLHKLYAGCRAEAAVAVIDVRSNTVVKTIPVGENPKLMCLAENEHKLYVGNAGDSTLSVVDCQTDSVVATLLLADRPDHLCYNPVAGKMYCDAGDWSFTLHVIDCRTDSIVARLVLEHDVIDMEFDPSGNRLYDIGADILVLDGSGDSIVAVLPQRARVGCLNPASRKMFCIGRDSVTVVDCETNTVIRRLDSPGEPEDALWSPICNRVYSTHAQARKVAVYRDSMPGIEEQEAARVADECRQNTIVRGVLYLRPSPFPLPVGEGQEVRGRSLLLDAAGRQVLSLSPGPNDVRHLAPGVYFVRRPSAGGGEPSAVTKVVVTR